MRRADGLKGVDVSLSQPAFQFNMRSAYLIDSYLLPLMIAISASPFRASVIRLSQGFCNYQAATEVSLDAWKSMLMLASMHACGIFEAGGMFLSCAWAGIGPVPILRLLHGFDFPCSTHKRNEALWPNGVPLVSPAPTSNARAQPPYEYR